MSENRDFSSEVRQQDEETEEAEDVSDQVVPSSATPKPESGEPSRTGRPGKESVQEDTAATNKIDVFPDRKFLFKMRVTPRDVVQGRLFIPEEIALHHFPPFVHQPYEEKITISNHRDLRWFMTSKYDHDEYGFVINSEWREFSFMHDLEANDVLFFYKPFPDAQDNHYLIIVFKIHQEPNTVPEFRQENYLFQRELTGMDAIFMLMLPREEVNLHFPAVRIPVETHKCQRLYFTDAQNKDWRMTIKLFSKHYVAVNGWDGVVEEHGLEIGDVIRFYKPVRPFDSRHFLIKHVKRGVASGSNDLTQPGSGSAAKDGSGDGKGGN